ncbi:hypothetical protein L798_11543 [Zootermopsis nevadensis]|uniref:Uncharacterized protein n=1 Tax=Zootermopsis nevadensis TaxID=136037 RepID=A0A067QP80_ZOONE|nr:hypothetical protein L798_11543 [Zootermopsis nevadensis]
MINEWGKFLKTFPGKYINRNATYFDKLKRDFIFPGFRSSDSDIDAVESDYNIGLTMLVTAIDLQRMLQNVHNNFLELRHQAWLRHNLKIFKQFKINHSSEKFLHLRYEQGQRKVRLKDVCKR